MASTGRVPCSTFGNDGRPLCSAPAAVPEPSSLALLGLGFLALVFGLRTGRPGRMHRSERTTGTSRAG